jgi:hypothetical protein
MVPNRCTTSKPAMVTRDETTEATQVAFDTGKELEESNQDHTREILWTHSADAIARGIKVNQPRSWDMSQVMELQDHYSCDASDVDSKLSKEFRYLANMGSFCAGTFDDGSRGISFEPSVVYITETATEADLWALGRIPYVCTVESIVNAMSEWEEAPEIPDWYVAPKKGKSPLNRLATCETWGPSSWPIILAGSKQDHIRKWIDNYMNPIYQDALSCDYLSTFWWPMDPSCVAETQRQVRKVMSLIEIERRIHI